MEKLIEGLLLAAASRHGDAMTALAFPTLTADETIQAQDVRKANIFWSQEVKVAYNYLAGALGDDNTADDWPTPKVPVKVAPAGQPVTPQNALSILSTLLTVATPILAAIPGTQAAAAALGVASKAVDAVGTIPPLTPPGATAVPAK